VYVDVAALFRLIWLYPSPKPTCGLSWRIVELRWMLALSYSRGGGRLSAGHRIVSVPASRVSNTQPYGVGGGAVQHETPTVLAQRGPPAAGNAGGNTRLYSLMTLI
jgi:hypothetical protein